MLRRTLLLHDFLSTNLTAKYSKMAAVLDVAEYIKDIRGFLFL
jgi:hypothetical protein